jgi:TatD DNase family protein
MIDTHAHLDFPDYNADRDEMIARAQSVGLRSSTSVATEVIGEFG